MYDMCAKFDENTLDTQLFGLYHVHMSVTDHTNIKWLQCYYITTYHQW